MDLKTSHLFFMGLVSSPATHLPDRHFEKEILPSALKVGILLCVEGPSACTLRPATASKMTGASHEITETVAEGRGWAGGDNRLGRLKWWGE